MSHRSAIMTLGLLALLVSPKASAAYQEKLWDTVPHVPSQRASSTSSSSSSVHTDAGPVAQTPAALSGFSSGATLTRAELTALMVEKLYSQSELERCFWDITSEVPPAFSLIFTDVHVEDRYAKHICVAMRDGIVNGYADGSFRPDRPVNFAESAKIISRAYVLAPFAHTDRLAVWYKAHVEALAVRNAIPTDITALDQYVTYHATLEMMTRLSDGITWRPSRSYEDLAPPPRKPVVPVKPKPATTDKPATSSAASSSSASVQSAASSAESSDDDKSFWNPF